MKSAISMQDAVHAVRAGKSIVIVCKSYFEAESCAVALSKKGGAERRKTRVVFGDGCVEFAWLETSSGRRLDDFHARGFQLEDFWDKTTLP